MIATRVYMANGMVRWACDRAFWPLFFTRLVTDLELSPLQLVLLGTCYEAAIFLSEIPTGVVADVYSRRLSVIISYLMGGAAFITSAVVSNYGLLILSQVLVGVASTFHSGAETAWITDEQGSASEVEDLILRRGTAQLIAAVGGIVLFSLIAVATSLGWAIAMTGAVLIAWGVILVGVMGESQFTRREGDGWTEFIATLRAGWNHSARQPALKVLGVVVVTGGLAKEVIDRLDIQRLVDVGLPDSVDEAAIVGVLVAVRLLLAAALLVVARRLAHGRTVVPTLMLFLVGTAVGIVLLAQVELLGIAALGLVLQGGFHGASAPLVTVWTNTFASSDARATVHSFIGQGESFGEVVGGVTLGAVAEFATVPIAMTISACLFAAMAAYASRARNVDWPSTG